MHVNVTSNTCNDAEEIVLLAIKYHSISYESEEESTNINNELKTFIENDKKL